MEIERVPWVLPSRSESERHVAEACINIAARQETAANGDIWPSARPPVQDQVLGRGARRARTSKRSSPAWIDLQVRERDLPPLRQPIPKAVRDPGPLAYGRSLRRDGQDRRRDLPLLRKAGGRVQQQPSRTIHALS